MTKTNPHEPLTTNDIEELLRTPGSTLQKILGIEASQIWTQRLIELNQFIQEVHRRLHTDLALWRSQHTVSQSWGLSAVEEANMQDTLAMITANQRESTTLYTQLVSAKEQLDSLIYRRNDYVNTMPQIWREQREAQTQTFCAGLEPLLSEMREQKIREERAKNPDLSHEQIETIKRVYQINAADVEVLDSVRKPQELVLMKDPVVPAEAAPQVAMDKYNFNVELTAMRVLLAKNEGLDSPHHIELLKPSEMKKLHALGAGDLIKKHLKEAREQDIKKMTEINEVIHKLDNEISNQYTQVEQIEKKLSDLAAKIKLDQDRIEQLRPRPTMKPK